MSRHRAGAGTGVAAALWALAALAALASCGSVTPRWPLDPDVEGTTIQVVSTATGKRVGTVTGTWAGLAGPFAFLDDDGELYARDARTGREHWRAPGRGWTFAGTLGADGEALLVDRGEHLVLLDRQGRERWRVPAPGGKARVLGALAEGARVFVIDDEAPCLGITTLDRDTGEVKARASTTLDAGPRVRVPTADERRGEELLDAFAFFGGAELGAPRAAGCAAVLQVQPVGAGVLIDTPLAAFLVDGELRQVIPHGGRSAVSGAGVVLAGLASDPDLFRELMRRRFGGDFAFDLRVSSIDAPTGRTRWSAVLPWRRGVRLDSVPVAGAADAAGERRGLVLVRDGRAMVALDAATGARRWRTQALAGELGASGDTLVVAHRDVIAAYDLADGTQRWRAFPPRQTEVRLLGVDVRYAFFEIEPEAPR